MRKMVTTAMNMATVAAKEALKRARISRPASSLASTRWPTAPSTSALSVSASCFQQRAVLAPPQQQPQRVRRKSSTALRSSDQNDDDKAASAAAVDKDDTKDRIIVGKKEMAEEETKRWRLSDVRIEQLYCFLCRQ